MKNLSKKIATLGLVTTIALCGYGAYKSIDETIKHKESLKPALYIVGGSITGLGLIAFGKKIYDKERNYEVNN